MIRRRRQMALDEIVSLFVNNGIGIACIIYFMYRDYKFMQKITDLLAGLHSTLEELKDERSAS